MAVATLSGNSLRQNAHTHCASVHQTAKFVAALLRVAEVTAGWRKVMAAYRRVYQQNQSNMTLIMVDKPQPTSPTG